MIEIDDIHSLTDFQRNAKSYVKKLRKTGRPLVLTVNGKPGMVVLDAEAYKAILDEMLRLQQDAELEAIRKGLEECLRGETVPADEVIKSVRKKHGFKS